MRIVDTLLRSTQTGMAWVSEGVWKVEHAFERVSTHTAQPRAAAQRIGLVLVLLFAGFVALMVFAARAALFSGLGDTDTQTALSEARATLIDRNGTLLAANQDNFRLFVDPGDMTGEDRPIVRQALKALLPKITDKALEQAFSGHSRVMLVGWLKPDDRTRIMRAGLPGVSFETQKIRGYPLGQTGAGLIGMTERGGKGLSGAERALNDEIVEKGQKGHPVQLAMDLRVQGALQDELVAAAQDQSATGAVGIVTNVRTGEILAMASYPEFDPNAPGQSSDDARKNRAAASVYEVGSVFKLLTLAIGLETGTANTHSLYDARSPLMIGTRKISDFHAENRIMSLDDVFSKSSNIGAVEIAKNVGLERMIKFYKALGLFDRAQIELRETAEPLIPKKWSLNALASSAFGHGMSITPLSYAQAANAVINDGVLVPFTIKKRPDGVVPEGRRIFSESTSQEMKTLMRANVLKGTGGRANAPGLRVGGKTGTADKVVDGKYAAHSELASFQAAFPIDAAKNAPLYAVFISFDDPQGSTASGGARTGGAVAAPVAGRVINRIAPFLGVVRRDDKFTPEHWDRVPVAVETPTNAVGAQAH